MDFPASTTTPPQNPKIKPTVTGGQYVPQQMLVDRLRFTRLDYQEETKFHEFLYAAYTGGGGFRNGQVPTPSAPPWGRHAYEYTRTMPYWYDRGTGWLQNWSYITAFRNEDTRSYNDRVACSVYSNYVQVVVNVVNAFVTSEVPERAHIPPPVQAWAKAVDIHKNSIDSFGKDALRRAQVVGECWTWFEAAAYTEDGLPGTPKLRNLWPQQILDYDVDTDGLLVFAKIRTYHTATRANPLDPPQLVERITIITRTTWHRYDIDGDDKVTAQEEGVNSQGVVPIVLLHWDKVDDHAVRGLPQIGAVAQLARALHNRESELDHNLRTGCFPQLVLPDSAESRGKGVVDVGPGNAIVESEKTRNITRYVAPPPQVTEAYRKRCADLTDALYRSAVLDRSDASRAETYESKKQRFLQTKARLADVATALEGWELGVYGQASLYYRVSPTAAAAMSCQRPKDFHVEEMDKILESALKLQKLPIGPDALAATLSRLCRRLVPGLPGEDYEKWDKQIATLCTKHYTPAAAPVLPKGPANTQPGISPLQTEP